MTRSQSPAARGQRLSAKVAATLEREIREGCYPPNSKLPTEAHLMARFGISRTVIREAIAELRRANLVYTQQGSGTYIAATLPPRPVFSLTADEVDLHELRLIYQMRREIEAGAAAQAAIHANQSQRHDIALALDRLANSLPSKKDSVAYDLALHQAIASATGNHFFCEFIDFFYNRMSVAIATARRHSAQDAKLEQIVQVEHQNIVEAILSAEPEEARAAMRLHLTNASRRLGLLSTTRKETP
ncbi:FadR family transcriptional regulator [Halomonas sp. McH1-25]|uniref:FadR/GntR family transcriptional regulator n=1 Tax=unclassified Halomonas TaxID=2609666 RepID=UPI001EF54E26|nr:MULTISPECIES: FadR/GntR family transcriptional regulator [unclassified Halomonas]MCG7601979.1 FadR family transcriptional regulator [Halomonas sp. McH1-25]MCP1341580.1 FadR family transcriptional regulator [Halomonas sp. FL8]MCP1360226.1 FadR family transcriptional regulator [Halomonas sp. BBD45]MCP1366167.1 FadR family transcriptional regulator [Halomonas sp. BBD48]